MPFQLGRKKSWLALSLLGLCITSPAALWAQANISAPTKALTPEEELIQLAKTDSKDKVYILALETDYNGGMRKISDGSCTLESYVNGQDKLGHIVVAAYKVATTNQDPRTSGKKFAILYKSLDELWSNYDSGHRIFSLNNSRACAYYIDFAKNIYILKTALQKQYPQQGFEWGFYDSRDVIAKSRGFSSYSEFYVANQIGADVENFAALKKRGVTSVEAFKAIVAQMNQTGYPNSGSAANVIVYLDDKEESAKTGKSPAQIKAERDKRVAKWEAEMKASQEAEARNRPRGYYMLCQGSRAPADMNIKTVNCAARSDIRNNLLWAWGAIKRERPDFANSCMEAINQLDGFSGPADVIRQAAPGWLARCNTGLGFLAGPSRAQAAPKKK